MQPEKQLVEVISALVLEIRAYRVQRENEFEWIKSHSGLATKQDLKLMEQHLVEAIQVASVTPSIKVAVVRLQSALDQLDASIPDKEKG